MCHGGGQRICSAKRPKQVPCVPLVCVLFPVSVLRIESEDEACAAIRCAAHSLQLLLKDLESTPLVRGALAYMELLLQHLEPPQLQDRLKDPAGGPKRYLGHKNGYTESFLGLKTFFRGFAGCPTV